MALCLIAAAIIQSSAIKMEVVYSEVANLTYQLDTVAGLNRASDPRDFQALWKRDFLKSPEDQLFLDRWKAVRAKYDVSAQLPSLGMPLSPRRTYISLGERLKSAGLESKTFEEYEMGLNLLVLPTDAPEFTDVIQHFRPKFHKWWTAEAAVKGKRFADGMQTRLGEPKVVEAVERFRRFYGSQIPAGYRAPFSLIYRPMLMVTPTSGEQLGRVSVVEFLQTEKPEQRLDVVLHEFCHFLYGTRSPTSDQKLQNDFLVAKDPAARPCYNLMNEGLATAMGNGIIGRLFRGPRAWKQYLETPRSFYNNVYIDRAGKRLLRLLDENPDATLDTPLFVNKYIAVLKEEFGEEINAPTLFLNDSFIYVNQSMGRDTAMKVIQALHVSSAWTRVDEKLDDSSLGGFRSLPHLSGIFIVPASAVPDLALTHVIEEKDAVIIQEVLKTAKSVVFAKPRTPMACTYVLVAEDEAEASRLIDQLAAAKKGFQGIANF